MKRLFVRRDSLLLTERAGEVEAFGELPDFLRQSPLRANIYSWDKRRWSYFDLLPDKDDRWVENLSSLYHGRAFGVPALWSGYRSCITEDVTTGELFRLKGVAFGEKPYWNKQYSHVEGGQFLRNAHFEQIYSERFNQLLREEGLEPVMEYVGLYKFPHRVKNRKLAASIMRVKGDTRLDELFTVLEFLERDSFLKSSNSKGQKEFYLFRKKANPFYESCGFIVGQLKHLLDKSWQTWSDNPKRTNAHIGNVVVYENEEGNVALGLVDFDASDDLRDKSKSTLRAQQKKEYETIIESAISWPACSYRTIGPVHEGLYPLTSLREKFAKGFEKGYKAPLKKVTNVIPAELLEELVELGIGLKVKARIAAQNESVVTR